MTTVVRKTQIIIYFKLVAYDCIGFWRDDKLRAISTGLIQQVDVCLKHQFIEGKALLRETLVSLVEGVNDDSLLKAINLNVLMHTRSEEASVRLFALTCSEALWQNHGNKLLGT
jgi:U3 small nucleolar RNA-associated protein 10